MRHRAHRELPFVDSEFAHALTGSRESSSRERQAERKARQLCRQVQRALNLALAERGREGLYVEEVTPAPDCSHLLVHIVFPAGSSILEVLADLRDDLPHLRAEVASAITRKRTPELSFVPSGAEAAGDV